MARSDDPTSLLRLVLRGSRSVATNEEPTGPGMPSFAWQLNDEQIAAVAKYVRNPPECDRRTHLMSLSWRSGKRFRNAAHADEVVHILRLFVGRHRHGLACGCAPRAGARGRGGQLQLSDVLASPRAAGAAAAGRRCAVAFARARGARRLRARRAGLGATGLPDGRRFCPGVARRSRRLLDRDARGRAGSQARFLPAIPGPRDGPCPQAAKQLRGDGSGA